MASIKWTYKATAVISMCIAFLFSGSLYATEKQTERLEPRNEQFQKAHPEQYKTWKQTSESTALEDGLAGDPNMVIMWAGYGFAKDYNKARGHFYAVDDLRNSLRTGGPTDATNGPMVMACWSCKGPDVARLIEEKGEDGYFTGKWAKGGAEVVNAIGCSDCHDTRSEEFKQGEPALKLTRPHVERAMAAIGKPFEEGTRLDKQAQVCAQCHVEYYFTGPTKAVKFPWDKGTTVDQMEEYYDDIQFKDWTHAVSKAPMPRCHIPLQFPESGRICKSTAARLASTPKLPPDFLTGRAPVFLCLENYVRPYCQNCHRRSFGRNRNTCDRRSRIRACTLASDFRQDHDLADYGRPSRWWNCR